MTEKSKKIINKALKKQRKIIDFVDKATGFYNIGDFIMKLSILVDRF